MSRGSHNPRLRATPGASSPGARSPRTRSTGTLPWRVFPERQEGNMQITTRQTSCSSPESMPWKPAKQRALTIQQHTRHGKGSWRLQTLICCTAYTLVCQHRPSRTQKDMSSKCTLTQLRRQHRRQRDAAWITTTQQRPSPFVAGSLASLGTSPVLAPASSCQSRCTILRGLTLGIQGRLSMARLLWLTLPGFL